MIELTKRGLVAMEKPGGLKHFTIPELWIFFKDLEESDQCTAEKLDRIKENIFMLIKGNLEKHEKENHLTFPEAIQLIRDLPENLTTTTALNGQMKEVKKILFDLAFLLGRTTENQLDILEEAEERGYNVGNLQDQCRQKAVDLATTTKDRVLLQRAGIESSVSV